MAPFFLSTGERTIQIAKEPFDTKLADGVIASELNLYGASCIVSSEEIIARSSRLTISGKDNKGNELPGITSYGVNIFAFSTPVQIEIETAKGEKISGTIIYQAEKTKPSTP